MKEKVLGDPAALISSKKFQKKGLPHVHILIILKERIRDPKVLEDLIWAQLPEEDNHPRLLKKFKKCMVLGPCKGATPSRNRPCSDIGNKKCRRGFHEPYCHRTP